MLAQHMNGMVSIDCLHMSLHAIASLQDLKSDCSDAYTSTVQRQAIPVHSHVRILRTLNWPIGQHSQVESGLAKVHGVEKDSYFLYR